VAVDGRPLTSETQWAALLAERRPGEAIRVATLRGRARMEATVTLDEEPRLELVPLERAGGSPSAAQLAFREAWLGGRTNR